MRDQYDNWKVLQSIGEGGQSHVFLVEDTSGQFSGKYVLKRLKNHNRLDRFIREIGVRVSLKHSQIPVLVAHRTDSEPAYIVEEYVEGKNLTKCRDLFESDLIKTLSYFRQICQAVAYAHSKSVVHRDIKPDNIIYDATTDSFKITDFGICFLSGAEGSERLTTLNEVVGPRGFVAPELEGGRAEDVSCKCDVYSLGKLLYWMLTGRVLPREYHRSEQWNLFLQTKDPRYARINWLLDDMIVENAENRLKSVDEVVERVKEIVMLTEGGFNVIGDGIEQRCIYCGRGHYKEVLRWGWGVGFQRGKEISHEWRTMKPLFRDRGGLELDRSPTYAALLICDYCGNRQVFWEESEESPWTRAAGPTQ